MHSADYVLNTKTMWVKLKTTNRN